MLAAQPDAYASGNPGCLVQVTAALRRAGRPLPAFHPVELVDASIRGVDVSRAAGGCAALKHDCNLTDSQVTESLQRCN